MAIESDQLVFDYLSRVGDLAQQRQLSSSVRMRLVTELRREIEARRSRAVGGESPASVRRLLARIGTPEELVTQAESGQDLDLPPESDLPTQRSGGRRFGRGAGSGGADRAPGSGAGSDSATGRRSGLRRTLPRPRRPEEVTPPPSTAASPPHLAGEDELGRGGVEPDWWRVDATGSGPGDGVPGFVGGIEIPEILRPPQQEEDAREVRARRVAKEADDEDEDAYEEEAEEEEDEERPRRRLLRRRRAPAERSLSFTNPLLLIAAALLVAGAVMGHPVPLICGWGIAYASRRLTRNEAKLAVMWVPGLAVASGLVWLWGRVEGRWGQPIGDEAMGAAVQETIPWVVRGAAAASALFLVWRSQRASGE
ncbi:hypothetical protein ACIBI4_14935 [Streptomyces sp. NPDC050418]|uniref:hypothetical protein n=1 Tax=Streptomyces sp. NPDC050418 TaxID=3365612 RepID=UPI0037B5D336